jgi:hypothetical protein
VNSWRQPEGAFTFVLHRDPDLDCAAATYLATSYLTTGRFPEAARVLANYVDHVDAGHPGFSEARPFTLYAAHLYLGHRLDHQGLAGPALWERWGRDSLRVIGHVVERVAAEKCSILDVDAFDCPRLFEAADRADVLADLERYRRHFAAGRCRACVLRLADQFGGEVEVDALLARDVQNEGDAGRCIYFKDWARTDATHAPRQRGFVALSVFESVTKRGTARCILSVRPDTTASLEGLGAALEQAEVEKRLRLHGVDARMHDTRSGERLADRQGYGNPDPWYDGRDNAYTIVDAPRAGTILTADEIEGIFLRFGKAGQ